MYPAQQHCFSMQGLFMLSSPDLLCEHATGNADQPVDSHVVHAAKPEAVSDACLLCAAV